MVSLMDLVPKKHKFELGQVQSNPYHRVFKPIEEQDDSGLVGDDHEQVELFGFHTKNYDICQSAVKAINTLKKARMTEKSKEILIQLVKIQDDFFGIEKKALKEEKITEEDLKGMINRLNEIHHRVGMLSARFKSDLRKHFTYTTMHIFRVLPHYEN
tara:strand:- start:590 stop:1060 length:471 start_codon:yes stop_codon:yes gene_type:complete